ncbi:MAG: SDR family oxidoreductase [Candidatus Eremiobacteraeota bacterium]|nr:SDR family oxidoreductase [Candidatus Eremiobacteraeota bacterium]
MKDRIVLVTGASSGIGLAAAKRFALAGASLVLVARGEERLQRLRGTLESGGVKVLSYCADVGKEEEVRHVVSDVADRWGAPDVLVNNAGVGYRGAAEDLPPARFDEMLATNVRGPFLFTRHILPLMKKRGAGHIVYVSSGAGKNGIAGLSGYCASKFALMGFAESVALEAKPFDVKISVVVPGSTNTDFHRTMGSEPSPEARSSMIQPEDIAETIYHVVTTAKTFWIYEVTTRAPLMGR